MYTPLPYVITDCFCVLYALSTLMHLNTSMGSEHEIRRLKYMIVSYIVFVVSEIVCAACDGGLLRLPTVLYLTVNAVCVISLTLGCWLWFLFVEARLHPQRIWPWTVRLLVMAPALLVSGLDAASVFTRWMFTVDQSGAYISTGLFSLQGVANFAYLLIPTLEFLWQAFRTGPGERRKEYMTYAVYMAIPLAAGLFEDFFTGIPVLELSIFLMIHIFFITIQNTQVYNDALTGLNNRRRLNKYLEECLPRADAERPILLFIMDINCFKSINDAFGHLEGDSALRRFAAVLRQVAARYDAFIARYGGDEFCLAMEADGRAPEEVEADIHDSLADAQSCGGAGEKLYTLTVSIGCARCAGEENSPDAALARADRALYEEKAAWHKCHA